MLKVAWLTIDSHDPRELARFWAEALGYDTIYESPVDEDEIEVLIGKKDEPAPRLLLLQVPDGKTVKNRLHLDLRPADRDEEVERLSELGATKIDIGQGPDVSWVVMADPEGNEFCVLRPEED